MYNSIKTYLKALIKRPCCDD